MKSTDGKKVVDPRKRNVLPETRTGGVGSSKRNVIRRHQRGDSTGKTPKQSAEYLDDVSTLTALDSKDPNFYLESETLTPPLWAEKKTRVVDALQ